MNYKVVENRGAGINYTIFTGNEQDCEIWMFLNTREHPNNPDIKIHIDEENVNGNGEPFTYTIEVDNGD